MDMNAITDGRIGILKTPISHYEYDERTIHITDACGDLVAVLQENRTLPGEHRANAVLIVRAVNAHAELIDALFAANTALAECQRTCWVGACHRDKDPVLAQVKEARETLRAALRKAGA